MLRNKKIFDLFELSLKSIKLFVIILFDSIHFLSDFAQLDNLVLDLILKLRNFLLKVVDCEVFKHNNIMSPVLVH